MLLLCYVLPVAGGIVRPHCPCSTQHASMSQDKFERGEACHGVLRFSLLSTRYERVLRREGLPSHAGHALQKCPIKNGTQ